MNGIASAKASFADHAVIFRRRHDWIMCWLYLGTFGSFIGFAAGFPLLIKSQLPVVNALTYAWLGPLVGAIIRPFGEHQREAANKGADAQAQAIGDGNKEAAAVLGFSGAIGAYGGGFSIPKSYGTSIAIFGGPEQRSTRSSCSTSRASLRRGGSTHASARRCRAERSETSISHFFDRLTFFTQQRDEFADGHGVATHEDRTWEDGYRKRWQHDKIVRYRARKSSRSRPITPKSRSSPTSGCTRSTAPTLRWRWRWGT